MRPRFLLTALIAVLASLAVSCSATHMPMSGGPMDNGHMDNGHMGGRGDSGSELTDVAPGTPVISVVAREYSFTPDRIEARNGPATISMVNRGQIIHDFTVDELDIHFNVDANEEVARSYRLRPGKYEIYCSVAGHKALGMVGTLEVT